MDLFEIPTIVDPVTGETIGGDFSGGEIHSLPGDLYLYILPDGRQITADLEGTIISME